jgi:acetyltransferase
MKEVFNFAKIFDNEPLPKGNRVQIITNGGGYGVLSTDAVLMNNLKLAKMSAKSRQAITRLCPPYAVIKNPMDLTGDADNKRYKVALEQALKDKNVDSIILIILFQVPTIAKGIDEMIEKILKNRKKPVALMTAGGKFAQQHKKHLESHDLSTFASPFVAAEALKALTQFKKKA